MSIFGTPRTRSGHLGGPASVVISGEGQSTVLTYRDPNLAVEISISDKLKEMGNTTLEGRCCINSRCPQVGLRDE